MTWAIIGGSGFEKFDGFTKLHDISMETPFGQPSPGLKKASLDGTEIFFLPRHGKDHQLMPSEINFRANIFSLKSLGVTKILSVSAVGSLQKDLVPGDMVVPNQYINRTLIPRHHTFCGEGITAHVSLAHPVSGELIDELKKIQTEFDFQVHFDKTYVCIEGPQFSTKAEARFNRTIGADIVGMTNFPEYALAREAGIAYLPCSFVTDYDCWDDSLPHVTLQQVLEIMHKNNHKAFRVAQLLIPKTAHFSGCKELGLSTSLLSKFENLTETQKTWLTTLMQ